MSVSLVKNKPIVYGLTGGIATGKSTACNYLIKKGIKVFDSDQAVRDIWKSETLINKIIKDYKINLLSATGKEALAKLIFSDKIVKDRIESLIHPLVFDAIKKWEKENQSEKLLIIDMPLLFEVGYHLKVYKTILIYTNKELQLKRLMKRNKLNKQDAILRINSQIDIEAKRKMADIIIDNSNTKKDLYDKLDTLVKELLYED